jgi:hypothetical protein
VRARYLGLIDETLQRYDIDGLELDFLREPYVFPIGREAENRDLLTAWIDTVRQRVSAAERKLGHPIHLGVRVPADPEITRQLGLDAVTWAHQGLVDLIVASPRWATIDNDVPVHTWKSLLRGTDVPLACGLEVRYQPYENGPAAMASPDVAGGAAMAALAAVRMRSICSTISLCISRARNGPFRLFPSVCKPWQNLRNSSSSRAGMGSPGPMSLRTAPPFPGRCRRMRRAISSASTPGRGRTTATVRC